MNILFIEDEQAVIEPIKKKLESKGHNPSIISFGEIKKSELAGNFDIIVLDLMDGGGETDPSGDGGKEDFKTIWESSFCPVIAYSSNPDLLDSYVTDENREHPFISKIAKGSQSPEALYAKIEEFRPYVEEIRTINGEINNTLQNTLRDSAKYLFPIDNPHPPQKEVLARVSRRRVAALMDMAAGAYSDIAPWEQYIFPPISKFPLMGDIICQEPFDQSKAELFYVILTPSCDLEIRDTAKGKRLNVEKVLCVKCEDIEIKDNFTRKYKQGFKNETGLIPGLSTQIPTMSFNFKKNLCFINYKSIGNNKEVGIEFVRIASMDSPFREHLAWHFLQIMCRPGTPDRDFKQWEKDITRKVTSTSVDGDESN